MNHRQMVSAVARRFPDFTIRQIEEVLEVLVEVWRAELAQPNGDVTLRNFGKLSIEVQQMRSAGAVRRQMQSQDSAAPDVLTRIYFRFRPTENLRTDVEMKLKERK